jgi:protein-glutamine gamma-glutamyltransferase
MNAARRPVLGELGLRVGAFAAFGGLAAWQWARMVSDPPADRVVLAVAALGAGAALLALISTSGLPRPARWAFAGLAVVVCTTAGLVAIGIPVRLLGPEAWDDLGRELGRGFAGLDRDVEYPYAGKNEWSRLVLLAGLPLALGLAATFAFWPAERTGRGSRTLGLVILIATCAVGATVVAPQAPLLLGVLLLALVAAWLWLPGLDRRDAIAAGALLAIAAGAAVALAPKLDVSEPWLNYRSWDFTAGEAGASFDWDHDYGPLDWPRDGETLLAIRSDGPHYWRASVLEDFDGVRWERPAQTGGQRLEAPTQVEGASPSPVIEMDELNANWIEVTKFTFGPLHSEFVLAPGTPIEVSGLEGVLALPDGTMVSGSGGPIEDGDAYTVVSYVPDPTGEEMRAASEAYPPVLTRYTEVGLPVAGNEAAGSTLDTVTVPLSGTQATGGNAMRERLLASPYAEMYRQAQRLTANEPTIYDAVRSLEAHLRGRPYTYSEAVPAAGGFPLADFVSEDRAGYCQQFSGTMALMLRMVGIPARVVTGFSAGARDAAVGDRFLVSDFDAHSWVEVYFTGIGWVPFDPTPAAAPASSQIGEGDFAQDGALAAEFERGQRDPSRRRATEPTSGAESPGDGAPWIALPIGFVALGLAVAVPAALRRRRFRSLPSGSAAEAQLRELGSGLERLGIPLSPGETLLGLERELRMRWKPTTADYVARLRGGRFERDPSAAPTLRDRRRMRRELGAPDGVLGRLRALLAIPPGAPMKLL